MKKNKKDACRLKISQRFPGAALAGKRYGSFMLTAAVAAGCSLGFPALGEQMLINACAAEAENTETKIPEGMELITKTSYLELYFDEKSAEFAIKDTENGEVWYSAPQKEGQTSTSSYFENLMKAQLTVQYYNESVQSSEMDSCNDSVEEEQFTVDYLQDGVTVTYTIGEAGSKLILPEAISEARMLSFMENMSEKGLKKINRNYTLLSLETMKEDEKEDNLALYGGLEDHNVYVLRSGVKDYLKEELMEYFAEAGYTAEDLELDNAELTELEEVSTPWFIIPVTYRLEEDSFVASVDPSAITYNDDGYYLTNISLLPYFGAGADDEEGYLFVPDGSGALIYLNNGKTTVSSYDSMVYGQDTTMMMLSEKKSEIDNNLSVKLPVYGIKADDKAWLAVIEDGDAYANIAADISGKTTSYNHVYSHFSYLEYGGISLGDMVGSNSMQMYSTPNFSGNYTLRFFFGAGDDADYSWMAARYRNYLEDRNELTRLEEESSLPFYAEYIGAIDKYATILGIRYRSVKALTTYAQAEEITEMLTESGIEQPIIIYRGWANGGLAGTAATKIKPVGSLEKGGVKLSAYLNDMKNSEIPVYMAMDYQRAYQDTLFDGYSSMSLAPRYFDHTTVKEATYLVANGMIDEKNISLISPHFVESVVNQSISSLKKLGISGVDVSGLSNNIFTDMLEERYTDAQAAKNANSSAMEQLAGSMEQGILTENANAYAFSDTKNIINAPMSSNNYYLIDEEIPFYQMVLHGYMNYAGDALNLTDDYQTSVLKSLESGSGLYFQWIYADNSVVKETEFDYLYSICYEAWFDKAVNSYRELSEILNPLQSQTIVKHEKDGDLAKVTYEDGTQILVNYGKEAVKTDGVTVEAMSYAVQKGGR